MRPFVLLALLAASLVVAAACGGDDDDNRTAGIIHRLLQAAGTDDTGTLESFVGELPEDLPAAPPLYPGADLIVSSRQPAPFSGFDAEPDGDAGSVPFPGEGKGVPQPLLYFIVLDTGDGREAVFSFYEEALDEDPWQLESSFSTEQLDTLQFFNVDDIDIAGAVSIARGGADQRTSILISLQDAGAIREGEPPFELGESLPLPKEFPPDVPVSAGAIITGTAFFREPGSQSFLLIFLTTDSQDNVIELYREEFQRRGWTVLDTTPFGLEDRIDFRDEEGDIQGDVLADRFTRSRRYTEVRLQVQVNPAREPVGEATPPDRTPPTPKPTEEPVTRRPG